MNIDFFRTAPGGNQRIVDYDVKINGVFGLPDAADDSSLGDNPHEGGYIRYNAGDIEVYDGSIWKSVGGSTLPSGGTTFEYLRGDQTWQVLDTSVVPENTNLYYTATRFNTAFSGKSTTNLSEGTNLYYTDARVEAYSVGIYLKQSAANVANGYAKLDGSALIPLSLFPDAVLGNVKYKGTYDGSTVTSADATLNGNPLPSASSANQGFYFIATAGFTNGGNTYVTGDWIISDGSAGWTRVENSDAVTTVFGRNGNIVANASDYASYYASLTGSYSNPTWITGLAHSKITYTGTTSQYVRGDGSFATFPTAVSSFTNDAAYITASSSITGNAATATKLATARNINGVAFDGSANITVSASTTAALTIGTGLTGTSFNGSSGVTITVDQSFAPTWTGIHTFSAAFVSAGGTTSAPITPVSAGGTTVGTLALSYSAVYASTLQSAGSNISLRSGGVTSIVTYSTGNTVFQNGGTFADAGYRLDVQGTLRATGLINANAGLTVAGAGTSLNVGGNAQFNNSVTVTGSLTRSGTASWATTGNGVFGNGTATINDTGTAASGTNAIAAYSYFGIPNFTATNTGVTYTTAATMYINGAPTAGTNVTIANGYALYVAAGAAGFNSTVSVAGSLAANGGISVGNNIVVAGTSGTTSTGAYLFAGASSVNYRTILTGTSTAILGASNSYSSFTIGSSPIQTASSGTNALLASAVFNPLGSIVLSIGSTLTDTATVYINGAASTFSGSGTQTGNNYALWVKGSTRFDNGITLSSVTASTLTGVDANKNIISLSLGSGLSLSAGTLSSTALTNPMTTAGDMIYGAASGVATRFAGNTTATVKFLTQVSSGAPVWTDLFGTSHNWGGIQLFTTGVALSIANPITFNGLSGNSTNLLASSPSALNTIYLPDASGTVGLMVTWGQVNLTAGVANVSFVGIDSTNKGFIGFVDINGGLIATTARYKCVCSTNFMTITAIDSTGATNTSDTSTLNYQILP